VIPEIAPHLVNVLMLSSIYVLAALGFALVFSVMRIMNFAHGAIYMAGGYICYYFWVVFGFNPWVSMALTMLVTALFGLLIERFGVLLVEQNVPSALQVADRGYALHVGRIALEGDIDKFRASEIVKRAYFGE
jgi:branched-subunit amino acid ABC-type transport system permease component